MVFIIFLRLVSMQSSMKNLKLFIVVLLAIGVISEFFFPYLVSQYLILKLISSFTALMFSLGILTIICWIPTGIIHSSINSLFKKQEFALNIKNFEIDWSFLTSAIISVVVVLYFFGNKLFDWSKIIFWM